MRLSECVFCPPGTGRESSPGIFALRCGGGGRVPVSVAGLAPESRGVSVRRRVCSGTDNAPAQNTSRPGLAGQGTGSIAQWPLKFAAHGTTEK